MVANPITSDELELLDLMISGLEKLIVEADESPFTLAYSDRPRRAIYRVYGNAATALDRKPKIGEAVYLDHERLVIRCLKTEVVRMTPLEVTVQAEKSGRGETLVLATGKVRNLKRVRGGYEIEMDLSESRKSRVTPGQKLRECLRKNDSAAWNRWCQDIGDTIELPGMDLKRAELAGYDLCCADLTGSDLTEANLSSAILAGAQLAECKLDRATVTGADFFRAVMVRTQASLVEQSGMPEMESVIYET